MCYRVSDTLLVLIAASQKWAVADRGVAIGQIVAGGFIILLSLRYLYQFTETTGIFLGGLLIASGCMGYFGGMKKNANMVNLQLVTSIVGILLAFQFMGEVARDAQVDCALAELYHKGKRTEKAVEDAKSIETMHAVFSRLAELEDSISMVKEDAVHMVELRKEQQNLRFTDLNYIRAKVQMVKKHAEEVLSSVLQNDSVSPESISKMPENEKAALRRKLDMADKVLAKITKSHEEGTQDLSIEEYREILLALTDASVAPEKARDAELLQAMNELPNMEAALQRKKENAYSALMVGTSGQHIRKAQKRQMERSKKWEGDFAAHLQRTASNGKDYVADLPEHCIKETAGEKLVMIAGVAMILLQLAATYVSLSLTMRLPTKSD